MSIIVTLLGTAAMVPTKERNVSGLSIEHKGEVILFDCGEGTQRQMNIAGINRQKVTRIFISHWHADHVGGLLGLIQTLCNAESPPTIHIYGPIETRERVHHLLHATYFDQKVDLHIHELDVSQSLQVVCKTDEYRVEAISLHHTIPCVGYAFIEEDRRRMKVSKLQELGVTQGPLWSKLQRGEDVTVNGAVITSDSVTQIVRGKKISYVADTVYCEQAVLLSEMADVVVCEATYNKTHEDQAQSYFHLTSEQAAQIVSLAGAKKLILTHISQRYSDVSDHLSQARALFSDTELGFDLMRIKL